MNLVIRAVTLNDQPVSQAIVGYFDERGGTIGRSDTNTLTLPDPKRHISRLQAEIGVQAGRFHVRNAASANPIFVNGRVLNAGEQSPLADRDELRIGSYALGVSIESVDNDTVRTITQGRPAVDARAVIAGSAVEPRTDPRRMMEPRARPPGAADAARGFAERGAQRAPAHAPQAEGLAGSNPFADLLGAPDGGAAPVPASDPFAGLLGAQGTAQASARDPFADLFGAPAGSPPPAAAGPAASRSGASPSPASIPAAFGPAGTPPASDDPFAFLDLRGKPAANPASGQAAASAPPAPPFGGDPFAAISPPPDSIPARPPPFGDRGGGALDLLGSVGAGGAAPSIDTVFGLGARGPAAGRDPMEQFLSPPDPGASSGQAAAPALPSTDPMALFGAPASPPPAPAEHAAFDHTPELRAAYRPPSIAAPRPPVPAVPEPAGVPVGAGPAAAPDALWAAFCDGAGVRVPLPQGLTPEQMNIVGQLLKAAVEGIVQLMAVRATTKNELRAAVTTIKARDNNPLKFSPTAPAALEQLLQPPLRGFLAGPAAMRDAMHDLVGHGIGTMTGMRAALAGVLERFEPAALERKLSGNSLVDSVLPMNRKARLWELYLQHFGAIRDEARDDFDVLFGAAFVAAYEEQIARMEKSGR